MSVVLVSISLFYIAAVFLLYTALNGRQEPPAAGDREPFISVLIPAHNEAKHLPRLFDSLEQLQYRSDRIECILVNDRSSDETGSMMADFCSRSSSRIFLSIQHRPEDDTGKNNALMKGAARATGEYLFFTDADCSVPPLWIETTLAHMTPETGAVAGPVIAKSFQDRSRLISRLQSLDWALFSATGAAFSSFGKPLGMFGNNMCIRKNVYDSAGGFAKTKNSITEDYAMFDRIRTHTRASVYMHMHPAGLVITGSETSLKQLIRQRIRWALGLKGRTAASLLLTALSYASILAISIGALGGYTAAAGAAFLAVTGADLLLFIRIYRRLGIRLKPIDLLCYKPYQLLLAGSATVTYLLTRKIHWKETSY